MSVRVDFVYEGALRCQAVHEPSGSMLSTEAPVDNGGTGQAFSPTDLMATALGSCMLTTMGIVAEREGIDMKGSKASVIKEMMTSPKRRLAALKATIILPKGLVLNDQQKAKLERAAHVCPVHQSLHPDVNVILEFEY